MERAVFEGLEAREFSEGGIDGSASGGEEAVTALREGCGVRSVIIAGVATVVCRGVGLGCGHERGDVGRGLQGRWLRGDEDGAGCEVPFDVAATHDFRGILDRWTNMRSVMVEALE